MRRLQKQHQQQVLRGAGSGGLASEQQPILANGGAHGSPSLPPAADSGAPLQQQGSMQAPAKVCVPRMQSPVCSAKQGRSKLTVLACCFRRRQRASSSSSCRARALRQRPRSSRTATRRRRRRSSSRATRSSCRTSCCCSTAAPFPSCPMVRCRFTRHAAVSLLSVLPA